MVRVLFDDRPGATSHTGIARYARTTGRLVGRGVGQHAVLVPTPVFASASAEAFELSALLEREAVDVFHSPLWHLPAVLPCRALVTVHDAIPATHPSLANDDFRRLWAQSAQEVARADAVICPTQHARERVVLALGLDPTRVHVVPEAPDATFSVRPAETVATVLQELGVSEPYVLSVGSLERRKNPDGLLDAVASLPAADRPLVVFAGPAAGFDVAAEAARRGLGDRTRHVGLVSDEQLAALYTGALALVLCSRAEGFGLPIVEAWACGAPVIASNATALPEVVGDAALLVDPEDPATIAAAISQLASSAELRQDLAARGRARLDARYSATQVLDALARVYDTLEAT